MKQTGLIIKAPVPTDYFMGGITGVERKIVNTTGNWKAWLPSNEKQAAKDYSFDTLSCTTFSAMNFLETLIDYMMDNKLLSDTFLTFLKTDGYLDANGKLNCSDRWIAIKSGTTIRGNDFGTVWNTIRNVGLIPETMFPFGGNSFDEYHSKANLTPTMDAQAKKWLTFATVMYEWVFYSTNLSDLDLTTGERQAMTEALKESPVHMGSPKPASHAVMAYGMGESTPLVFDTYEPFDTADTTYKRVHFAIKGSFTEKSQEARTLRKGMNGDDVKELQSDLNFLMVENLKVDGDFGSRTFIAVIKFQTRYGLSPDGVYGKLSRAMMKNKIAEKKTLNLNPLGVLPLVQRMATDLVEQCATKGMPIRITSGLRTFEKQQELYDQGRTKPGNIVTNAKPGYSFHNYGIAIDVYAIKGSRYSEIAKIGKKIGFEWGGDFKTFVDLPHFEVKLGYSISDFLNKKVDFRKYD